MTAPPSQQVRTAGETVAALNTHQGNGEGCPWSAADLAREADSLEAEEKEAAETERTVQALAREMFEAQRSKYPTRSVLDSWDGAGQPREDAVAIARELVESGWRKEGSNA